MFPFKVAPALIYGNTVVLKLLEKAPRSSLRIASLAKEAGLPPGVLNVVRGFGEPTGSAISLDMKIRKISFTGSVAIKRKILNAAADSNIKSWPRQTVLNLACSVSTCDFLFPELS